MKKLIMMAFSLLCLSYAFAQSSVDDKIGNCKQVDEYTVECDVDTTKVDLKDEESVKELLKQKGIIEKDNSTNADQAQGSIPNSKNNNSKNGNLGEYPYSAEKPEEINI